MHANPASFASELRLAAEALRAGSASSGAAAQLAGIPRAYFLMKLADYGVDTFTQTEEELGRDLENA